MAGSRRHLGNRMFEGTTRSYVVVAVKLSRGKPLCTHAQWRFVFRRSSVVGPSIDPCVLGVVDVERHDKALCCAFPNPRKLLAALLFPSLQSTMFH